jgi:hypothetical protein
LATISLTHVTLGWEQEQAGASMIAAERMLILKDLQKSSRTAVGSFWVRLGSF